ncbi:MAG: hypothetical protein CSB44_01050 [Gammaproteobacteria bacterium]|nr:MAG: hypothetical protein CSB44_01050 [Gammaproteobacteria bacterium]
MTANQYSQSARAGTVGASAPAVLLGVSREAGEFTFEVISTGCTRADDFSLDVQPGDDGVVTVTLLRHRVDPCRRRPFRTRIHIVSDDPVLSKATVVIANPLAPAVTAKRQDRR